MIGKTISHYKIIEKLGEGGMGVVYKAEDTKLDRIVALKFLPHHLVKSEQDKARFLQEAKAASASEHPNVCVIYDIQEYKDPAKDMGDKQQFIIMQYVDGKTLKDKLQEGSLVLNETIDYATQIGEALQTAHSKGIIHRDIKSENIMVTSTGQIKVMDFGLAKLRGSIKLTKTSTTVGTVAYMSPEHIQGQDIDARSDIFSFGVVLYEMLTNQLPFQGEYDSAIMYSIMNNEPEPIEKFRTDLSSEFLHVLNRALEKNPGERYQSVDDMLIDLKRLKRDTDKVSRIPLAEMWVNSTKKKSPILKTGLWLIVGIVGLAVILFTIFQFIEKGNKQQPFIQMQITQVTTHGKAKEAAISPDGKYIVHVMEEKGKQSLWLRQVATGSNVEILAPTEAKLIGLTFSNDGNYIYYVILPLDGIYGTLYQMPVLGGTALKVCERVNSPITFSPDSKKLAFIRMGLDPITSDLILFELSQKREETLSTRNSPSEFFNLGLSWSPDGQLIACMKANPEAGEEPILLVVVSVADGRIKNLTPKGWGAINQIAWLNDGSGLIISAADKSTGYFYRLWFVSYPEGQAHLVTPELNNYLSVSLTRDMTTILTTKSEWTSNIWVAETDSPDKAQQITSGTYAGFFGVAWTPDGRLVYGSRDFKLWVINRDGSHQKLLSGDESNNRRLDVSPDGRFIVFPSWREGAATSWIWRMDIDGNNPIALTEGKWDDYPRVSPDGQWVVYNSESSGQFTLWKISINGGSPIQLLNHFSCNPAISADGKWLACFGSDESDQPDQFHIIVIPFEGGEPTFRFPVPADIVERNDLRWTPDGKSLAYLMESDGSRNIWIKTLDNSSAFQLTHLTNKQIYYFDWSKDGKYLAYAAGVMNDDVVLIRNFK